MSNNNQHCFIIFLLSLIPAMALRIAPWPGSLSTFAPDWILLVLLYWTQILPSRFGVLNAWLIGIFTDVLTGRLLGQHALAYALTAYLSVRLHKPLRQFEFFRQELFVFFSLTLSHTMVTWTQNLRSPTLLEIAFWYPIFSGMLFWPVVFIVLHSLCLTRKII